MSHYLTIELAQLITQYDSFDLSETDTSTYRLILVDALSL